MLDTRQKCAGQHFGPWMIEPAWFAEAVAAVQAGTYPVMSAEQIAAQTEAAPYDMAAPGVAILPIHGSMTKHESSFGGASTIRTRKAIRKAVNDAAVQAILLHVDSPGGTVAGTADLAAEVQRANASKPVHAYIEDLGASAAYWVASQARRISANSTGMIGSIGTVAVVEDVSGAAEAQGIKVHVISTGAYKGAFAPGAAVTEEQLLYLQDMVNGLNEHFLTGIRDGRNMPLGQVRKLADGRMHIAAEAKKLGLIDAVQTLDEMVAAITATFKKQGTPRRAAAARRIRVAHLKSAQSRVGD